MDILKELYYGKVSEVERGRKNINVKAEKKEEELYDKIKSKLPEEDKNLMDEFLEVQSENYCEEIIERFIQGVKTGIIIGIETSDIELWCFCMFRHIAKKNAKNFAFFINQISLTHKFSLAYLL